MIWATAGVSFIAFFEFNDDSLQTVIYLNRIRFFSGIVLYPEWFHDRHFGDGVAQIQGY